MKRPFAKGRRKRPTPGKMNKLETRYANYLEVLRHSGDILWWAFEGIKFKLADNTFYTPDFAVMLPSGEIEIHETKGHWREDARVKIKVAASKFPFKFVGVQKEPASKGGAWKFEYFGSDS